MRSAGRLSLRRIGSTARGFVLSGAQAGSVPPSLHLGPGRHGALVRAPEVRDAGCGCGEGASDCEGAQGGYAGDGV